MKPDILLWMAPNSEPRASSSYIPFLVAPNLGCRPARSCGLCVCACECLVCARTQECAWACVNRGSEYAVLPASTA